MATTIHAQPALPVAQTRPPVVKDIMISASIPRYVLRVQAMSSVQEKQTLTEIPILQTAVCAEKNVIAVQWANVILNAMAKKSIPPLIPPTAASAAITVTVKSARMVSVP